MVEGLGGVIFEVRDTRVDRFNSRRGCMESIAEECVGLRLTLVAADAHTARR